MMTPEVDRELGRMIGALMEAPYPVEQDALLAEIDRRLAVREHWLAVGRRVATAAELHHALAAEGEGESTR